MPFLSKMVSLWRNIFRQRQVEQDLNDELQAYVDEMVERKAQAGIAPESAREAVLLELGGMDRITDLVRQQRIGYSGFRGMGTTVVVAMVAFVSGASAATGVLWHNNAEPVPAITAETLKRPSPPPKPLSVLQGRIVDRKTGEPIPLVEVGLEGGAPIRRYTYTDDKGYFSFANPPVRYKLQTGKQSWWLSGPEIVDPRGLFQGPNEIFDLSSPTDIVVTDRDGRPLEGERREFNTVRLGKPVKYEYLRFDYAGSIVELRARNLQPGKIATSGDRKGAWVDRWLSQGR